MHQDAVTRTERELATLETELGRATDQLAKAENEVHRADAGLAGKLSDPTRRFRESQLTQARNREGNARAKVGEVRRKVATKKEELHRHERSLQDAEKREREEQQRKEQHERAKRGRVRADASRQWRASPRPLLIERFGGPPARSLRDWLGDYSSLIYLIEIHTPEGNILSGTAFLYAPRRFATCAHNILGVVSVVDPLAEAQEAIDIQVHPQEHSGIDVATFTLPDEVELPSRFIPAAIGLPRAGDDVAALAYPAVPRRQPVLGFFAGHVEALPPDYRREVVFIQVSIALAGGMSGGPVINQHGQVVGIIAEATFEANADGIPGRRFSHAVPIAHVLEMAALAASELPKTASHGALASPKSETDRGASADEPPPRDGRAGS